MYWCKCKKNIKISFFSFPDIVQRNYMPWSTWNQRRKKTIDQLQQSINNNFIAILNHTSNFFYFLSNNNSCCLRFKNFKNCYKSMNILVLSNLLIKSSCLHVINLLLLIIMYYVEVNTVLLCFFFALLLMECVRLHDNQKQKYGTTTWCFFLRFDD